MQPIILDDADQRAAAESMLQQMVEGRSIADCKAELTNEYHIGTALGVLTYVSLLAASQSQTAMNCHGQGA